MLPEADETDDHVQLSNSAPIAGKGCSRRSPTVTLSVRCSCSLAGAERAHATPIASAPRACIAVRHIPRARPRGTALASSRQAACRSRRGPAAFIEPEPDPSIEDYAVIGNCRTLALVSRFGSIDWLCLPDFSSASYFAALLDRDHGGRFALTPKRVRRIEQGYVDGSNVLRTTFHCADGVLELTDFIGDEGIALGPGRRRDAELLRDHPHRALPGRRGSSCRRCTSSAPTTRARERARLIPGEGDAWRCQWAGRGDAGLHTRIALVMTAPDTLAASVLLRAGEQVDAVLVAPDSRLGPHRAGAARRAAERAAGRRRSPGGHAWCGRCTPTAAPMRRRVMRSILALKLMTCSTTGRRRRRSHDLAARGRGVPQLGLPLLLDSRHLVRAALVPELGLSQRRGFLDWLLHATRPHGSGFQVMYDIHGETELDEHKLPHSRLPRRRAGARRQRGARAAAGRHLRRGLVTAASSPTRRRLDPDELRVLAGLANASAPCGAVPTRASGRSAGPAPQHALEGDVLGRARPRALAARGDRAAARCAAAARRAGGAARRHRGAARSPPGELCRLLRRARRRCQPAADPAARLRRGRRSAHARHPASR